MCNQKERGNKNDSWKSNQVYWYKNCSSWCTQFYCKCKNNQETPTKTQSFREKRKVISEGVAQLEEHQTFNLGVESSNLSTLTKNWIKAMQYKAPTSRAFHQQIRNPKLPARGRQLQYIGVWCNRQHIGLWLLHFRFEPWDPSHIPSWCSGNMTDC